ncbi:dehydrase and lipid transport-domain-containing protein [Dioszegia hungarica]|uniref:Dehydrase and lipid transport-domain-containing protein n=1 Tax=Dioszegia hungarica TaxID=4972 RepID=A0AA38LWZ6_9TREE|nr:dehydrase and lipid transport-domain-containing protein [Dioszegia hungarica]KAI9638985.1 dehydrase and lipid transport-domain-containing protein [Dioszegia hungarica]
MPDLYQPPTVADARRAFFSLPDISKLAKLAGSAAEAMSSGSGGGAGEVQTDGERQTYHARKILPYSPEQLYNLVADIPSYSSFIPFCTSSTVLQPPSSSSAVASTSSAGRTAADSKWSPPASGKSFEVDAELKVGFGGFDEAYVSRVKGTPYESVSASAGEANLFRSLSTTWAFSPASGLSPHPSTAIPSTTSSSSANTAPRSTQSLETPDSSRGPTLLTIDLAFEFTNPLHRIASQAVLPKVAGKMVDAFEQRCVEVYGKGRD